MDYSKSLDNVKWEKKSYIGTAKYSKMNFDNDTASGEFFFSGLEENIIYVDFHEARFFKYFATDYFLKRDGKLYAVRIEYSDLKEALSKPPAPKFTTETEKRKVIIPIPAETKIEKLNHEYEDFEKFIKGKEGSKVEIYEIKIYPDGRREEKLVRTENEILPTPNIKQIGTKPIYTYETKVEYEDIPIPLEPEVVLDNSKYANTPDETISHGKKGKITREYKNRYYKDQFKDRQLVNTTRVEAKPKKIRRGTKAYITRSETGRNKKVIPIPKDPQTNQREDQWEDYNVKISDGQEGSYYEEWRIDYYSDGSQKKVITNPKANLVEAKPIIIDKGIKPINWTKTREETILDEEIKEEIIFDNEKYEDEEDEILVHGTFGKTINTITEYYKKDDKVREEVTGTRRVEGRPKRIRRGKKRGEYLWRRLRVEYLDGKIEYIDISLVLDAALNSTIEDKNKIIKKELNAKILKNYDDIQTKVTSEIEAAQNSIILKVGEEYQLKTDAAELIKSVTTQMEQTNEAFTFKFNEFIQDLDAVKSDTKAQFVDIKKYIRFKDGIIQIGEENNEISSEYTKDGLEIKYNDIVVAKFSGETTLVKTLKAERQMMLGDKWAIRLGAYREGYGNNLDIVWLG